MLSGLRSSSSTKPLIEVSGLRSSCDAVATKSVLARSSRARSVTSRTVQTTPLGRRRPSGAAVTARIRPPWSMTTSRSSAASQRGQRAVRDRRRCSPGASSRHELGGARVHGGDRARLRTRSRSARRRGSRSSPPAGGARPRSARCARGEVVGHRVEGERRARAARAGRRAATRRSSLPGGQLAGGPDELVERPAHRAHQRRRSGPGRRSARARRRRSRRVIASRDCDWARWLAWRSRCLLAGLEAVGDRRRLGSGPPPAAGVVEPARLPASRRALRLSAICSATSRALTGSTAASVVAAWPPRIERARRPAARGRRAPGRAASRRISASTIPALVRLATAVEIAELRQRPLVALAGAVEAAPRRSRRRSASAIVRRDQREAQRTCDREAHVSRGPRRALDSVAIVLAKTLQLPTSCEMEPDFAPAERAASIQPDDVGTECGGVRVRAGGRRLRRSCGGRRAEHHGELRTRAGRGGDWLDVRLRRPAHRASGPSRHRDHRREPRAAAARGRCTINGIADSSAIELHDVYVGGRARDLIAVTTSYGKTIAIDPAPARKLWEFVPRGVNTSPGHPAGDDRRRR